MAYGVMPPRFASWRRTADGAFFSSSEHPYCLVLPFRNAGMLRNSRPQSHHTHSELSFGPLW